MEVQNKGENAGENKMIPAKLAKYTKSGHYQLSSRRR